MIIPSYIKDKSCVKREKGIERKREEAKKEKEREEEEKERKELRNSIDSLVRWTPFKGSRSLLHSS